MLICIIEDDESIRELEAYALKSAGYEVQCFENARDFYRVMGKMEPGLILLDLMLPGDDGLTALKQIREHVGYAKIPIIIVSARTTELDRVKGLDLGADDYLCKPFGVMELVSRVRARLRNAGGAVRYSYREIQLSEAERTAAVNGQAIDLTYKEFELLRLFLSNPGMALRRDHILETIWGYDSVGRTLDVHIRTLRSKLGAYGSYIVTIRGVGYKLGREESYGS